MSLEALTSELPVGTSTGGTSTGGTTTGGGGIARSVSRQARGKFNNFNNLPVNPLAAGVPQNLTAAINRDQEDAKQDSVRAEFVIGHFDHIAEDVSGIFVGSPNGAAQDAGGKQLGFFPVPEETDANGNVYHPALPRGGSNVRYQKWVRTPN
ncbi:MAG: hypothetical protein ABGZ53_04990 [Fuerstiella sp.]|nr:hypothetical protein [Fuerstiella sp.]